MLRSILILTAVTSALLLVSSHAMAEDPVTYEIYPNPTTYAIIGIHVMVENCVYVGQGVPPVQVRDC